MISAEEALARAKRANPARDARRRMIASLQRRVINAANRGCFSVQLTQEEQSLGSYLETLGYSVFVSKSHIMMTPRGPEQSISLCWGIPLNPECYGE
jgi:hypothetical protein